MAAIDKIYVKEYSQYLQFKEWCEQQPLLKDKYGKEAKISDYLYKYSESFEEEHPIFKAPYYIDAYVIKNCPFDFIQKELMINYGHWSQERIKSYYDDVINWNKEKDGECPYWAKPEDFIINEDGTMTIKGLEESTYDKIKRGEIHNTPFTDYTYTIGNHFKCIKHPIYYYNRPFKQKNWFIDIITPEGTPYMWYHKNTNTWDFADEFVISDWSSSTAFLRTIKALKRHLIKWKLPIGTIVRVTGRYYSDTYVFIIKK